jgi:hypothetical protein
MQAGGGMLCSEIHKLINPIGNKEELREQWKESFVAIYNMGDKTDYSNYWGISLLSASYKMLSKLKPVHKQNFWDHQCGFQCNRSATDQIFCIHQI